MSARRYREEAVAEGHDLDERTTAYLDALGSDVVDLVRGSIKAIRRKDVRREGFRNTIVEGNAQSQFVTGSGNVIIIPLLQLLRDCPTRWSSTYEMIARYIELYPAVALFARQNPDANIPLPSHQQFEVLQDISAILSILNDTQQVFSAEQTPTLPLVLPFYEALIQALRNTTYEFPELRFAIECAIQKLDTYIDKTRDLPVYVLAMVINPSLRFSWIDQHWGPSRRNQARSDVQHAMLDVRQEQYKRNPPAPSSTAEAARMQEGAYMRLITRSSSIRRASNQPEKRPASNELPKPDPLPLSNTELMITHMREVEAELARWEEMEWDRGKTMGSLDLVEFWKKHKNDFPILHQVAMNILPVQASSVSSERAFSSSKMTCTRERNNISAEHMEHLQVLKHSLHRRRASAENYQTLDFMTHVVGEDDEDLEN